MPSRIMRNVHSELIDLHEKYEKGNGDKEKSTRRLREGSPYPDRHAYGTFQGAGLKEKPALRGSWPNRKTTLKRGSITFTCD